MIHTHLIKTKTKKEQASQQPFAISTPAHPDPSTWELFHLDTEAFPAPAATFISEAWPISTLRNHWIGTPSTPKTVESGRCLEQMLPCAISNGSGLACLSAEPNSKPTQPWRFFSLEIGLVRFFHPSAISRTWLAQLHAHVFRPTAYVAGVAGRDTYCSYLMMPILALALRVSTIPSRLKCLLHPLPMGSPSSYLPLASTSQYHSSHICRKSTTHLPLLLLSH
jgi:hypothetical protein